jgi:signal transduction histidine kinase
MKTRRQLSIRTKLLIFLCAVSLIPLLLATHALVGLGGRSARALQELQVGEGLEQTTLAIQAAQNHLLEGTQAVAAWNELAAYLSRPDPHWPKANLEKWVPQSYNLDYLALYDNRKLNLYSWRSTSLVEGSLLDTLLASTDSLRYGLFSTSRDLYLLARSDIVTSEKVLGTLVFGRRLSHAFLMEIKAGRVSDLTIYYGARLLATTDTSNTFLQIDPAEVFTHLEQRHDSYLYYAQDQDRVIGFRPLRNVHGLEVAALGWVSPHTRVALVKDEINRLLLFFGLPLLATVLLAAFVLGIWIERPIRSLSKTMEEISRTGNLNRLVPVSGGGEISSMSHSFNQMLKQLALQRDELLTFRTMILAMKEGVLIENTRREVTYMNPRMEELLGVRFEPPRAGEEPLTLAERITFKRQIMEDKRGFSTEEVEWYCPDGNRVQSLKTTGRLEDPSGQVIGILSTFVDLTERNELELELIQASRMAFLGVYSQGIIHNLNGPLNTIMGFSSLLCRNHPDAEIPARINEDALRMSELINSLGRRWRRTGESRMEQLNINEIIREEINFLEADLFFKHNVDKTLELDANLPLVWGVYGDFSHALLNVLINAVEALTDSLIHKLRVRTRVLRNEICVEIEDTGVGIPPEDLDHIFLPFFSTKGRDRKDGIPSGAGLGLPIARKVLEPYSVRFLVQSEERRGTTMIIRIPLEPHEIVSQASAKECEVGL